MEFLTRVLSGSSRLNERAREAEQVNEAFKENLDNLKKLLESEESNAVLAVLDMVYESSFPEDQVFMKTPSRARLKSKKELILRLLIGLDSLGVPAMAELLVFIRKHGPEGIADSLLTLLEFMSPLLEGKEVPDFSTDDVVDAMDFQWHSTSRTGSPLLHVIASATSTPRASTASIGQSPLHPIISVSPYHRALSKCSMLISQANELGAKSVLDKTSTASTPPQQSLTMLSASLQYPSANQDFRSGELTILETLASPEITQFSTVDKPPSYSLDTFPESGSQRRHRRKSSSLRQLFVEDVIEELSWEGSVGASSKRNSRSSSWRRNSSEFTKIRTNTSETSSPMNPGLAAGDSTREGVTIAPDKTFLSTQDRHVNRSSRKGSCRISPSPPPDEVQALWREDSGGFSAYKNAAQTSARMVLLLNSTWYHQGGSSMEEYDPFCVPRLARDFFKDEYCWSPSDLSTKRNPKVADTEHGTPLFLHDSSDTHEEDAGHTNTHVQSSSDNHMEDVHSLHNPDEEARHGHTQVEEDAVHTHDHEKDARHTYSLDTCEEDAGCRHMFDLEQDGCETATNKITPEDSSQEGFQWISSPLLLPSPSNVSQNVNDQTGDISSFSVENDKDLNSMERCSDDEREDKELHAALSPCEDLQETGDVNPSCPIQEQGQVNIQYGARRDVPVQSCAAYITYDIPLSVTHGVHGMINDELDRGHLLSKFCNDAATLSHADVIASPTNGVTVRDSNELLDDQHPYHPVKTDEHLQKLPASSDSLSMETTALIDCTDHSSSTLQAPPFLESSRTLGEACLEEILQSEDGQSLKQEALGMKDDTSPGEKVNAHTSSIDTGEVVNSSLDTDSFNHSLNENIKPEMPEMMREDESKENVKPLDVHVEHPKVNDDQFEKLLSELDAAGASTPFVHVHPVESHVVNSWEECGGSKQASMVCEEANSKLEQDKQYGLAKCPTMVDQALQEGREVSKEASEVVDASGNHPFHDIKDHIRCRSPPRISAGARSAVQSYSKTGHSGDQLAVQFGMHFTEPYEDDYIQRPAGQYAGSSAAANAANDDHMRAGFMAYLKDHEHQNGDHLSHVFPLSNKTDGHPTYSSTLSCLQQNQPATFSDPTMDNWDSDTNLSASKRKGNYMGKLARGWISCWTKPHTNP